VFAVAVKAIVFRTIEKDHHTLIIFRDSWLVFSTFYHSDISLRVAMDYDIGFGGLCVRGMASEESSGRVATHSPAHRVCMM
jgi:hypothetical protein